MEYITQKNCLVQLITLMGEKLSIDVEVHDYPTFVTVAENLEYLDLATRLHNILQDSENADDFKTAFRQLCGERAQLNAQLIQGSALSLNVRPQSPSNRLCWAVVRLFWEPKTLGDYLTVLLPEVTESIRPVFLPIQGNGIQLRVEACSVQEYFNQPVNDGTVAEQLKNLVITKNQILDIAQEDINRIGFQLHQQLESVLSRSYADLAIALYRHNKELLALKSHLILLKEKGYSFHAVLTGVIERLRMGGATLTGKDHADNAGTVALSAWAELKDYMKSLSKETRKDFHALSAPDGTTLKAVITSLNNNACAEWGVGKFQAILNNRATQAALSIRRQLSVELKDQIKNLYLNTIFSVESEEMDKLPPDIYMQACLKQITISNSNDWVFVLLQFPPSLFTRLVQEASITCTPPLPKALIPSLKSDMFNETQLLAFDEAIVNNVDKLGGWLAITLFVLAGQRSTLANMAVLHVVAELEQELDLEKRCALLTQLHKIDNEQVSPLFCIVHFPEILARVLQPFDEDVILKIFRLPAKICIDSDENDQRISALHQAVLYPKSLRVMLERIQNQVTYLTLINHFNTEQPYNALQYAALKACAESLKMMLSLITLEQERLSAMSADDSTKITVLGLARDNFEQLKIIKDALCEENFIELITRTYFTAPYLDLFASPAFQQIMMLSSSSKPDESNGCSVGDEEDRVVTCLREFLSAHAMQDQSRIDKVASELIVIMNEQGNTEQFFNFLTNKKEIGLYAITPFCCIVCSPENLASLFEQFHDEDAIVQALLFPLQSANASQNKRLLRPAIQFAVSDPKSLQLIFTSVKTEENRLKMMSGRCLAGYTTLQVAAGRKYTTSLSLMLASTSVEGRRHAMNTSFCSNISVLQKASNYLDCLNIINDYLSAEDMRLLFNSYGKCYFKNLEKLSLLQVTMLMSPKSFPAAQAERVKDLLVYPEKVMGNYSNPLDGWLKVFLYATFAGRKVLVEEAILELVLEINKMQPEHRPKALTTPVEVGFFHVTPLYCLVSSSPKKLEQVLQHFDEKTIVQIMCEDQTSTRPNAPDPCLMRPIHYTTNFPKSLRVVLAQIKEKENCLALLNQQDKQGHTTMQYAARRKTAAESLEIMLAALPEPDRMKTMIPSTNSKSSVLQLACANLDAIKIIKNMLSDDDFIRLVAKTHPFAEVPFLHTIRSLHEDKLYALVSMNEFNARCDKPQCFELILEFLPTRFIELFTPTRMFYGAVITLLEYWLQEKNIEKFYSKNHFVLLSFLLAAETIPSNVQLRQQILSQAGTDLCTLLMGCLEDKKALVLFNNHLTTIVKIILSDQQYLAQLSQFPLLFLTCYAGEPRSRANFNKKVQIDYARFELFCKEKPDFFSFLVLYYMEQESWDLEALKKTIQYIPPDYRVDAIKQKNVSGFTMLHLSVQDPDAVKILLDALTPEQLEQHLYALVMNYDNKNQQTVLHLACNEDEGEDTFQVLIDYLKPADLKNAMAQIDADGLYLFRYCIRKLTSESIQILLLKLSNNDWGQVEKYFQGTEPLLHAFADDLYVLDNLFAAIEGHDADILQIKNDQNQTVMDLLQARHSKLSDYDKRAYPNVSRIFDSLTKSTKFINPADANTSYVSTLKRLNRPDDESDEREYKRAKRA